MKVEFDAAQRQVLDEMLLKLPGAKAGKMFGFPGYWTGGKLYIVQKSYVGVSGSIEVDRYDDKVISGRFSGTLGHWTAGQNPEEDPPSETIEVQNGVFKHSGLRQ
jgi:hypothetical protein